MVTVTEKAATQLKEILSKSGKSEANTALRLAVKDEGCGSHGTNLAYQLELTDATPAASDQLFDNAGIKVLVDSNSLKYLSGLTLDFVETPTASGFVFKNPQAKHSCGCGNTFSAQEKPKGEGCGSGGGESKGGCC